MDGTVRANIKPGMLVNIILKKDQQTGALTEGVVKNILTSAPGITGESRCGWKMARLEEYRKFWKKRLTKVGYHLLLSVVFFKL